MFISAVRVLPVTFRSCTSWTTQRSWHSCWSLCARTVREKTLTQLSIVAYAHRRLISTSMTSTEVKPKIVFVLGGPGAGKGTQCEKIVQEFGYVHLSAGDLLREECAREGSEYGKLISANIQNGVIVPVAVTCALIDNAMKKNMETGKNKFLIDGFPRNQDNLDGWVEKMSARVQLQFILFFDCPENVCTDRCLNRGKQGSNRTDDNLESLKKRILTYLNDSLPIIKYYDSINLVKRIDASKNPDEVFEMVQEIFKSA